MYYIKKNNFVLYFFFIFPFLFVTGPFLPDLIVSLSSIFTVLYFFLFINAFNMFDGINLQESIYSLFFF